MRVTPAYYITNGFTSSLSLTKIAEYFGFVAIVGERKIKIRVIVRRIGNGNFTFWSVMPDSKLRGGQRLYDIGIEDD